MEEQYTATAQLETTRTNGIGVRAGVAAGLVLLCSAFLPALAIFLGVLLILAVALHAWAPDLRPYVQSLLRMPVVSPSMRRARLTLLAGAGVLLVASGAAGATIRGQMVSQWEQRERRIEVAEEGVGELLERARSLIAAGEVESAEFLLLDADAAAAVDGVKQDEVDDLLDRVHRSGNSQAILELLTDLSQKEFQAFEQGASVPAALEFGEPALTARAVELALAQLERARQIRANR